MSGNNASEDGGSGKVPNREEELSNAINQAINYNNLSVIELR